MLLNSFNPISQGGKSLRTGFFDIVCEDMVQYALCTLFDMRFAFAFVFSPYFVFLGETVFELVRWRREVLRYDCARKSLVARMHAILFAQILCQKASESASTYIW